MSNNSESSEANSTPGAESGNLVTASSPFAADTLSVLLELKDGVSDELETAIHRGDVDTVRRLCKELPSGDKTVSIDTLVKMMDRYGRSRFQLMMVLKALEGKLRTLLMRDINNAHAAIAAMQSAAGAQAIRSLRYAQDGQL